MKARVHRDKILELYEKKISKAPRHRMLHKGWKDNVPCVGGVYVIWDVKTADPVYVGETCHLNHRFIDLEKKGQHTFRNKVAINLRLTEDNGQVSTAISKQYKLSFLPIPFGRKELEEFLILKWKEKHMFNKPPRRLILSKNYSIIDE